MLKILFYTFPVGHLVSDKEYARLEHAFRKEGMELMRWHQDKGVPPEHDIVMVKGWSHEYDFLPKGKPLVYYSIGAETKKGEDLTALNAPIDKLYREADYIVHISEYCKRTVRYVNNIDRKEDETVIIPACEANLPSDYVSNGKLKLATTCIPRPVKRVEELERLCKKFDVELIPAYGSVSDFSYYRECDGYIHLSRKEGMPNTVLEALAWGLPCIVTNYGGAKEAVGNAGLVIQNDPEHIIWDPNHIEPIDDWLFASAINEFRNKLPYLRAKVRERVNTELNDVVCARNFKSVFESLL